jgi:tryptophanase
MATRRVDQVQRLHAAIAESGLPIVSPAAGHCVIFDVADYMDVASYKNPATAFVTRIYAETGIRGGSHVSGMLKENCKLYYVRFAIPLCMPDEKVDALIAPFIAALKAIHAGTLPDLEKISSIPGITGLLNAHYKPVLLNAEADKIQAQA